jgi:hypothetical protein
VELQQHRTYSGRRSALAPPLPIPSSSHPVRYRFWCRVGADSLILKGACQKKEEFVELAVREGGGRGGGEGVVEARGKKAGAARPRSWGNLGFVATALSQPPSFAPLPPPSLSLPQSSLLPFLPRLLPILLVHPSRLSDAVGPGSTSPTSLSSIAGACACHRVGNNESGNDDGSDGSPFRGAAREQEPCQGRDRALLRKLEGVREQRWMRRGGP